MPLSPTTSAILSGKARFSLAGEAGFFTTKTIGGRAWPGRATEYEAVLPSPVEPGETWVTSFTVFTPMQSGDAYDNAPETQLYILTGDGEVPYTSRSDIKARIIDQIARQARYA